MEAKLNSNQLKIIAILAMTIDHLAWTLWPGYSTEWYVIACHVIGRLTAPIMWFFIADGYRHTHSVVKYAVRLFALAFVSHFAYNFCFGIPFLPFQNSVFNQTSVAWPLAWGLVLLCVFDSERFKGWQRFAISMLVCAVTFPSDWSCIAAMAVAFMGAYRGDFKKQMLWMMLWSAVYAATYFLFIDKLYGVLQLFTCLSIPLLRLYNGERGRCKWLGKLFYIYYPAHLAVFGLIRVLLK